ncbi:hypothetical protein QQ045_018389 [Rhodiola kirilowii]
MGTGSSPCASCKLLRRRCAKDCIFAPYFPSDEPHKFAIVHKVFGASNVSKMLQDIPVHQRGDTVSSLVYEATARLRDPVYGCVGAISYLQNQVSQLQMQLAVAQAEILCIQMQQDNQQPAILPQPPTLGTTSLPPSLSQLQPQLLVDDKSFVFSNSNLSQLLNYSSSASSNVTHHHGYSAPALNKERESMWA